MKIADNVGPYMKRDSDFVVSDPTEHASSALVVSDHKMDFFLNEPYVFCPTRVTSLLNMTASTQLLTSKWKLSRLVIQKRWDLVFLSLAFHSRGCQLSVRLQTKWLTLIIISSMPGWVQADTCRYNSQPCVMMMMKRLLTLSSWGYHGDDGVFFSGSGGRSMFDWYPFETKDLNQNLSWLLIWTILRDWRCRWLWSKLSCSCLFTTNFELKLMINNLRETRSFSLRTVASWE